MALIINELLTKNIILKCTSLILGILLWCYISALFKTTLWVEVPISFYNQPEESTIQAPETVFLQLSGYRNNLRHINSHDLAIHIDATHLHEGKNPLIIHTHNLFLPDSISVVNYSPLNNCIEYRRSLNENDTSCM